MNYPFAADYEQRVYAGVLGKIIGVYLGRPFEGWRHERIVRELGEIRSYVHERLGKPLIVTDDDISGTFTFVRALEDYLAETKVDSAERMEGFSSRHIGLAWLNYIIENKTVLWWGGLGNSTEHTAYLRLKQGIAAPASGSIAMNGPVVAQQIGAQIFIDGWAMVAPGNPGLAAELARKAGGVSHDGEAIYAAQVVAAIEAAAFVESDIESLLDAAVGVIPGDRLIARMIGDLRRLRKTEPDWYAARRFLAEKYGYDKFEGNCHVVPNHGVIILALLWGDGDFDRSMMIANTCGWDTDCNSGNVGCILGIRNGLAAFDGAFDWRGPIADRLFLATADPGRCITDALAEAYRLINMGRAMAGLSPVTPKDGARFHFSLPGAVQGFVVETESDRHRLGNTDGRLEFYFRDLSPEENVRASTATFLPPEPPIAPDYTVLASPTLYSGQTIRARFLAAAANTAAVRVWIYVLVYGDTDQLEAIYSEPLTLLAGGEGEIVWTVPPTDSHAIARVGVEVRTTAARSGRVDLDSLGWSGSPRATFRAAPGEMHKLAWCTACDRVGFYSDIEYVRVVQNEGRGLLIQGTRDWRDYRVATSVKSHFATAGGIAVRVQGMRRYYALLVSPDGKARLIKMRDTETVLGETSVSVDMSRAWAISLEANGARLRASVNGRVLFDVVDDSPLDSGAVALISEAGCCDFGAVAVEPV